MLPGIDLAQSDAARERRGDARIGELQPRAVDLALIGFDRAFVLAHERRLRIELLLRDRVLLEERAIALEIDDRVLQQRLVFRELAFGLRELDLERPRIDLGEQLARFDELAFAENHAHELPVDAASHGDGRERRHRAEAGQIHADVRSSRGCGDDRHWLAGARSTFSFSFSFGGFPLSPPPPKPPG